MIRLLTCFCCSASECYQSGTDYQRLQPLTEQRHTLETDLEQTFDRWSTLAERAENQLDTDRDVITFMIGVEL